MAAIEQRADVLVESGRKTGPVIAAGNAKKALDLLADAHNLYSFSTPEENAQKLKLELEIAVLKEKLEAIKSQPRGRREISQKLSGPRANHVRAQLQDPSAPIHRIYRTILLNAEKAGGSLKNVQTFEQAHKLGVGLVGLTHYLERSREPQPLVVVNNVPLPENPTANLQFDYGYTISGQGLELFERGEVAVALSNLKSETTAQAWMRMPMTEDPAMRAVMQSSYNSHFVNSDSSVTRVEGVRAFRDDLSADDIIPTLSSVELPLPMSNLYSTQELTGPSIMHDAADGRVESIVLPGNYHNLPRKKLVLIGSEAIRQELGILPAQIEALLGQEKGDVTLAMADRVITDLNIRSN
jgi:hypothetical protein